jgi:hypothetical protein
VSVPSVATPGAQGLTSQIFLTEPQIRIISHNLQRPNESYYVFRKKSTSLVCESGEIGKRTGLRIQRLSALRVQIPPLAPDCQG